MLNYRPVTEGRLHPANTKLTEYININTAPYFHHTLKYLLLQHVKRNTKIGNVFFSFLDAPADVGGFDHCRSSLSSDVRIPGRFPMSPVEERIQWRPVSFFCQQIHLYRLLQPRRKRLKKKPSTRTFQNSLRGHKVLYAPSSVQVKHLYDFIFA